MTQEKGTDYYFKWYKTQDLNSLSYCQLKEFRKFALWFQEQEIEDKIYCRMKDLIREGKVSDIEIEGAAYL